MSAYFIQAVYTARGSYGPIPIGRLSFKVGDRLTRAVIIDRRPDGKGE